MPTRITFKRIVLALLGGLVSYFAYPSPGFWPAIFISIGAIYISIRNLNYWRAFALGLISGFAFYTAQIYWISQYLGPEPLIALAGLEGFIFAFAAGFISLATKLRRSAWAISLLSATIWNGREWFSTHFPYGGFPWSRVAMSQSDSPLAFWVSIGGFGLLSFLVVFVTVLTIELYLRKPNWWLLKAISVASIFLLIPVALSLTPIKYSGSIRVVGIQGNANAGLFAQEEPGTIRDNHLEVTMRLIDSNEKFDLVVWPENASDINPDSDEDTNSLLRNLVDKDLKAPLIFGTITSSGEQIFNSSKFWKPGIGETDQYDKKRPVPFGEYVPDRDFFYALSPDLVGLITRGYTFGTRDGIFELDKTKAGILICFEEAIDELPREVVEQGATFIVAQTNNADFGHSDESVQQLAIAKLRAIETGRSIVNISTVGPSAIITAKGEYLDQTAGYVPDYVIADVPLSEEKNIAMSGGWIFDPICAGIALLICVLLILGLRRSTTKL